MKRMKLSDILYAVPMISVVTALAFLLKDCDSSDKQLEQSVTNTIEEKVKVEPPKPPPVIVEYDNGAVFGIQIILLQDTQTEQRFIVVKGANCIAISQINY